MNSKKLISMISLFIFLLSMPIWAFAMESTTAEIFFKVNNAPGTVIVEAVDDAPLPEQTIFKDVSTGKFDVSISQPGDYYYKIYQNKGTRQDVNYDNTVFVARITALVDENNNLYSAVTVYVEKSSQKIGNIEFKNTLIEPEEDISGSETNPTEFEDFSDLSESTTSTTDTNGSQPHTGDDSHIGLWLAMMAVSLVGIALANVFYKVFSGKSDKKNSN